MKSEKEVQEKFEYYERMLGGLEARKQIDSPKVFLTVSICLPGAVFEMLRSADKVEELIKSLPPEDRGWFREWLDSFHIFARQDVQARIRELGWVLGKEGEADRG